MMMTIGEPRAPSPAPPGYWQRAARLRGGRPMQANEEEGGKAYYNTQNDGNNDRKRHEETGEALPPSPHEGG